MEILNNDHVMIALNNNSNMAPIVRLSATSWQTLNNTLEIMMNKTRKVVLNEHKQPIGVVYTPKHQRTVLVANKEGVVKQLKTSCRKKLVSSMALVSELEAFDDSIYMLDTSVLKGGDKIYSVSVWAWPRPKIKEIIIGIHNVKIWLDKLACDLSTNSALFEVMHNSDLMVGKINSGKVSFI